MKRCPFCAELIQDEAIKCRFCGEYLNKSSATKTKWYHKTPTITLALLLVGPLALPLVWLHPQYKTAIKIIVSIIVIAATAFFVYLSAYLYNQIISQFSTLGIQ